MSTWPEVVDVLRGIKPAKREPRLRRWRVGERLVAWERPLRKSDLEALGDDAPTGDILGVRVPMMVKEALLASKKKAYFTTPHFDGYPAILVHLPSIRTPELKRLLTSASRELELKAPARRRKKRV